MPKNIASKTSQKLPGGKAQKARHIDSRPLNDLLGFHLRLASLELRRNFTRHVGDGNFRPAMASLLLFVAANPGVSQKSLSNAMHIDKTSLVPLLNEAESAGWLKRIRSQTDRRRHELRLTAKGKLTAKTLRSQVTAHEQEYLARFSADELRTLVTCLKRIYR